MSHYTALADEDRIKLARDCVRCKVPIPPVIALWLHEQGLYERITNPRIIHESTDASQSGHDAAGTSAASVPEAQPETGSDA